MINSKNKKELGQNSHSRSAGKAGLLFAAGMFLVSSPFSCTAAHSQAIANNTPRLHPSAKLLGPENPHKIIDVSIWLQPHNREALDKMAVQVYDPTSPMYRKFLTPAQFASNFAPTAAEATTVEQFFASHNLKVVKADPNNFFIRAQGTVQDVQTAFRVQLTNYMVKGKIIRVNDRDPYVDSPAALVTGSVSGLSTAGFEHPMSIRPTTFPGGPIDAPLIRLSGINATLAAFAATGATTTNPPGFFTNNCFPGVEKESFSTLANGTLPIATISGNKLGQPTAAAPGCGYTPPELQTAFGLNTLYKQGYNGAGQTIGIIDWCGTPTILQDANIYSKQFGLPKLVSGANFAITEIPTPSYCSADGNVEITLDVELAHAIAPGAKINLIISPSNSYQDLDEAEMTSITSGLANVISGSYGALEPSVPPSEFDIGNMIAKTAAVMGISTNFSTGDFGDNAPTFGRPAVNYPADLPYATAIGGTTLALNPDNTIKWQRGWGNTISILAQQGRIFDPPFQLGFRYGSTGGPSDCITSTNDPNTGALVCLTGLPKPAYQKMVPGKFRQVPDIAWLADPTTGPVVYMSTPGAYPTGAYSVVGGTSVACPMFSALWAITNQAAGTRLGQAAPYLYSMSSSAITDIVPALDRHNVTDSIQYGKYVTAYSAAAVAATNAPVIDGIWDYPETADTAIIFTFDNDSSLHTAKGWDNVTGLGVPNPVAFVNYFLKHAPVP